MRNSIFTLIACLLMSVTTPSVHAQFVVCGVNLSEIPGSVGGVGPGQNQNRDTITVDGPYFIQSSTIRFNPGQGIIVRDGGVLVLCGDQGPNELRGNFTPDWAGITVESGGVLIMQGTTLRGGRETLIRARAGSDVTILLSELVDGPGRYIQAEPGSRVEVVATTFRGVGAGSSPVQASYAFTSVLFASDAELIVDACRFVDFPSSPERDRGSDGSSVSEAGAGRSHVTLYTQGGSLELTRSTFRNIEAGAGGLGGDGGSGASGKDGENPFFGGAEDGENGGAGTPGRTGGLGGDTTVIRALDVEDLFVAHNSFFDIRGGTGGPGGNGGNGGRGGDGADGGNSVIPFVDGGDGGNGGDGGDGGPGGRSGDGGFSEVFRIGGPNGPTVIVQNTFTRIGAGEPGASGFGGNGGSRGVGGDGGSGGFGADDGSDGSNGTSGDTGARGPFGDPSVPWAFIFSSPDPQHVVRANNNIIKFRNSVDGGIAFQSFGPASGVVDISGNLVFNQGVVSVGASLGADTIVFGDPLIDGATADFPIPPANSPAVDAGINALTPPSLMRDVLGRPRYADVVATPDTGDNGGFPGLGTVDIGAVEVAGVVCPLDTDSNGRIDGHDILESIVGADFVDIAQTLNNFEQGCGG